MNLSFKNKTKRLTVVLLASISVATPLLTSTSASAKVHNNVKLASSNVNTISNSLDNSDVAQYAFKFLGTPYVWGANGPSAFDCSGFTKYVYSNTKGITLPRVAQAQYNYNQHVSESEAKLGDLVFFGKSKSSIEHVGIYLGNGKMIDAQNRGVITENVHASWWNCVGFARVSK